MSNIRAGTISGVNGTDPVTLTKQSAAKAWVNFNQISVSVLQSFNISSVTDTSSGYATHNLSNSMDSANFPVNATNGFSSAENGVYAVSSATSIITITSAGDRQVNVALHGDLA